MTSSANDRVPHRRCLLHAVGRGGLRSFGRASPGEREYDRNCPPARRNTRATTHGRSRVRTCRNCRVSGSLSRNVCCPPTGPAVRAVSVPGTTRARRPRPEPSHPPFASVVRALERPSVPERSPTSYRNPSGEPLSPGVNAASTAHSLVTVLP